MCRRVSGMFEAKHRPDGRKHEHPAAAGPVQRGQPLVLDDVAGEVDQDRSQGGLGSPIRDLPDGRDRHPLRAVPGDPPTDSMAEAPLRSVQMTRVAAEITRNARGQRRRSVPDRKNSLPSPRTPASTLSEGSARAWGTRNSLVETPKPGRIVNIAGGGRRQAPIWEMSG